MWFCAFVLKPCFLLYMGFCFPLHLWVLLGSNIVSSICFIGFRAPQPLDVALMCNKKFHATMLYTEKDQTGRDPSFPYREVQFHLMASGMNFAYYVLYRFCINPLSHRFLIGTIEQFTGQGKIWKKVWIFFPVMEPRFHIFLHIHLVWHKGNSLTEVATSFATSQQKYYFASYFLYVQIRKNSTTLQVSFIYRPGTDCRERRNQNRIRRKLIVKRVKFSTQLFHLVCALMGSNCHLQTTYCLSELGLLPVPYNLRQNHLKQAQIEKNNTRSVQIWSVLVISYS